MRILFLSRTNNGMAQMAEGLARQMFGQDVIIASAVATTGTMTKLATESMKEINIDIATIVARSIADVDMSAFDYVVSISERDLSESFPHKMKRMHWPLVSPLEPPAPEAELKQRMRDVRTALSKHVKALGKMKSGAVKAT
jgi:arsenate reductase